MGYWDFDRDYPKFVKIMTGVSVLLRVPMLDNHELEVYYKYLSTKFKSISEFAEAADKLIENAGNVYDSRKEFPRASSFIEFKNFVGDEKELELIARDAWNVALDEAIINGQKINPQFDDPILINTINKLGGWRDFCANVGYSITNEDLKRRSNYETKFIKTYINLALTGLLRDEKLIGVGNIPKKVVLPYKPPKIKNNDTFKIESKKTKEVIHGLVNMKKMR